MTEKQQLSAIGNRASCGHSIGVVVEITEWRLEVVGITEKYHILAG